MIVNIKSVAFKAMIVVVVLLSHDSDLYAETFDTDIRIDEICYVSSGVSLSERIVSETDSFTVHAASHDTRVCQISYPGYYRLRGDNLQIVYCVFRE